MSSIAIILIIAFLAAILFDVGILRWMAKKNRERDAFPQDVRIFGVYSPILTQAKSLFLRFRSSMANKLNTIFRQIRSRDWRELLHSHLGSNQLWIGVELLLIILWSLSFTLPYLNMDPLIIPTGLEYPSIIQSNHIWTRFLQCGACFMWNGSCQGGAPAFVDAHGSMLHPIVVITTLIAGVQNGAKLALIAMFMLAGIFQWWLAYLLGLGRIPRLWSGMMAVIGGQLAARMELGLFGMVLSTVCVSLVIPALVWLSRSGSRRSIAFLGISLASVALSGQGYLQIGLFFVLPSLLLLIPWESKDIELFYKRLALAGVIGFLIASPFLVPYLHFFPKIGKDINPDFNGVQPLKYLLLNLVIDNHDFYLSEALQKLPFPSINVNYIGWIPVILAIFGLFGSRNPEERRATRFLFSVFLIAAWIASAAPLKWLVKNIHIQQLVDMVAGIRHPSYIFGISVTAILGLSAIGLDQILKHEWPQLKFDFSPDRTKSYLNVIDFRWLMAIPLIFSLVSTRAFNEVWIQTIAEDPVVKEVNQALLPPDLQWVNPPFGVHGYTESATGMGMKMSYGFRAWFWKDRPVPNPMREASFSGPIPNMIPYAKVKDVVLYKAAPGSEYAKVIYFDETRPTICEAHGIGGDIDVLCNNPSSGTLIVEENSWVGWHAKLDGHPVKLEANQWLALPLPAGEHRISLRYRPWDVPFGIGLSFLGLLFVIVLWVRKEPLSHEINKEETQTQSKE